MSSFEYLTMLIRTRLDGDESRLPELFQTEDVFNELKSKGENSDWYHYERKSFDGCYLVKSSNGFETYNQDYGSIANHRIFSTLIEAATHFYQSNGFKIK